MSKVLRCHSTTTYSSIIGNVTSYIESFIRAKFPKNFFKKVIIADTNSNILLKDKDIVNYELPFMIIKPELSIDETFLETIPHWYESTRYIVNENYRRRNYYCILKDEEHQVYLYTLPTRIKINFQLTIKVPTTMYMYNTIQYFNNLFEKNGFEYINDVRLQTIIPKIIMINLAGLNNCYDLKNIENRTLFNDYLTKNTPIGGIEETINLATGNNDYYFTYIANILNHYPDRSQIDKNVKNLSVDECILTFSFNSELWTPNKFILEMPDNHNIIQDEIIEEPSSNFKFNMVIDTSYILPKMDDKHLLVRRKFVPDVNVEYDSLYFGGIMNKELKDALSYLKSENNLNENIFSCVLMCGNKALNPEMYKVDYENYVVATKHPMANTTYTILLYGNLDILNKVSNRNKEE